MAYAEVTVNSPVAQRRTFSYGIPSGLEIKPGQAVWVPFGDKTLQGVVLRITPVPAVEETRDIEGTIEPAPLLFPYQVALAQWLSDYYLSPLFECTALMLPPGFERRLITLIGPPAVNVPLLSSPGSEQEVLVQHVYQSGPQTLNELKKRFGRKFVSQMVPRLIKQRLLSRSYQLETIRIKPKMVPYLRLKAGSGELQAALDGLRKKESRQAVLLRYLVEHPETISISDLRRKTGVTLSTIRSVLEKGWAERQDLRLERDPLPPTNISLSFPLTLTAAQETVLNAVCASLAAETKVAGKPDIFLLRGVTGSGKTEIYLRTLAEVVRRGKRGIVLVPEIAMTPQIVERFVTRFPGRVAILHSELSLGEQFDEWRRIKDGEFSVVIGPRSAIFAPQPDLGVIIIDEEHEWTYKQQDNSPRYHTRQVATKLAELTGATVLLGSATPDVESYYKALNGDYRLLELNERVTPVEGAPLPQVEVVDLREELKQGNLSLFSESLLAATDVALRNEEQVLLFLNRRGSASFVECRSCGLVIRCRRCNVPLSYHFTGDVLICHQCNFRSKPPQSCPRCRSSKIKYLGAGTEKLEQETARLFPRARLLRWDSDVTRGHGQAHQQIFSRFRAREADILIGTQMITKGLDLPGVTVVGVISADITLNLPDFRAGERAFQLLSQVAGRAGRGVAGGKVFVQTYSPGNYAVLAAAKHDYLQFYNREIAYRRELRNPPFSRLVRLVYAHSNEMRCQEEASRMEKVLQQEIAVRGIAGVRLIGPAPAFIQRLRGRFRWQIILRGPSPPVFLAEIPFPRGWTIDVDPVGIT